MYCIKCGNKLNDNDTFCPNCGTKVGTTGNQNNSNISVTDIKNQTVAMKTNITSGLADLGKYKLFLFANLALLLFSLFFYLSPMFRIEAMLGMAEDFSPFGDESGTKAIIVISYLISAISTLVPLLLKKEWKGIYFLPEKATTIIFLFLFFVTWSMGASEVDKQQYGGVATFNVSAMGWMYLITTVCAIILAFKIPMDLKKQNSQ